MKYFQNITNLEQAKKHYRILAMQLHPDKGGSLIEFQRMQSEYKTLLLQLQNKQAEPKQQQKKEYNNIIAELGNLAKVLIENQVPQKFLKHKIESSQSYLEKNIFSGILTFLEKF